MALCPWRGACAGGACGGGAHFGQPRFRLDSFGKGSAGARTDRSRQKRMIPKSGHRFSDKIMRKQESSMEPARNIDAPPLLPDIFSRWFAQRGWAPRAHQLELLAKAHAGRSVLLIAPTGGGKTLAGFLPTLVELHERAARSARSLPRLRGRVR